MSKLFIAAYHYTRDLKNSRYPEIKGLDAPLFKQQVEFVKNNFNPVTMEEVIDSVENGTKLPDKAFLFTFDDGYIDNYTVALPILEEYGVQGSFFITGKTFAKHQLLDVNKIHYILASADINKLVVDVKEKMDYYRGREFDFPSNDELWEQYAKPNRWDPAETIFVKRMMQTALPEKLRNQISSDLFEKYVGISEECLAYELYMTEEQIATMKRHGMFIGCHGYDHYWLGNLSPEKMREDVDMALEIMDPYIDRKHWAMNYPYGSFNDDVLAYVKEKGACVGFSIEVGAAELQKDNPLLLPRLNCNDFPPKSENYLNY